MALRTCCEMTENTATPEKTLKTRREEPSPKTVVESTSTPCTAPLPFLEEGDERDDDPILIFQWLHDNATEFLQRWEAREVQVNQQNPLFNRPACLPRLYALLMNEFVRDIDGAKALSEGCIQCTSSVAFGSLTSRMVWFESLPWVKTVIGGELPRSRKLADLTVITTVNPSRPYKLDGELF